LEKSSGAQRDRGGEKGREGGREGGRGGGRRDLVGTPLIDQAHVLQKEE